VAVDEPDIGGASHKYEIWHWIADRANVHLGILDFQKGPIIDGMGVNGITQEALLTVLIDRLNGFQSGRFASRHNEEALLHLKAALSALQARTRERIARGVEGKLLE
jgi:hypothetical protein